MFSVSYFLLHLFVFVMHFESHCVWMPCNRIQPEVQLNFHRFFFCRVTVALSYRDSKAVCRCVLNFMLLTGFGLWILVIFDYISFFVKGLSKKTTWGNKQVKMLIKRCDDWLSVSPLLAFPSPSPPSSPRCCRCLMDKGFVRIGKWFFKPHELEEKSLANR